MWDDPAIDITWPALQGDAQFDAAKVVLSEKDKLHPPFSSLQ